MNRRPSRRTISIHYEKKRKCIRKNFIVDRDLGRTTVEIFDGVSPGGMSDLNYPQVGLRKVGQSRDFLIGTTRNDYFFSYGCFLGVFVIH